MKRSDYASMVYPRYVSPWCMSKQKRCFDLAASILGLVLLAPLMLLIACLIKVTSKGPVLFRQPRTGLHQKPFIILKFRTMKHSAEAKASGPSVTRQGDPRITGLGVLLRHLKLDELPQLINILRGEMSLVGPRPKIAQHEHLRMLCRPGITGTATARFADEEILLAKIPADSVEQFVASVLNPEKCRIDAGYMETARFSLDLHILAKTLFKIHQDSPASGMKASVSRTSQTVSVRTINPPTLELPKAFDTHESETASSATLFSAVR